MAIINGMRKSNKDKLKIEINAEVLENIRSYCKWSEIDNIDYFFEEAASYILSKDRDWKKHQKTSKLVHKIKGKESV